NLQLTSSVSVPVAEFFPERRILVDWCFAIGYDLPHNLSSFYSIPIWPGFANYHTKRELPRLEHNQPDFYAKYGYDVDTQMHPKDISAGELYAAIEDALTGYGFHDTCLLRSVCELAAQPFDDNHSHLLSDIVTFILSPTQHDGFLDSEQLYREVYEQAELDGFLGKDCAQLYAHCQHDILRLVSNVISA
ncbi:CG42812, partial [Drosophila busckii]